MKGGYPPVSQPWQGIVVFIAVLKNILPWTRKTPVSLWFMNPSGIWESNIHLLQPLIRRIQIEQSKWAARRSVSTRRTWLLESQTLLPTRLVFLQHSWVSILIETLAKKGAGVWLFWFSPELAAAKETSFQFVMQNGNQDCKMVSDSGMLQLARPSMPAALRWQFLIFKHHNLK